jgi:hypothetical protein
MLSSNTDCIIIVVGKPERGESFWEEIGFTDLLAILGVSKRN